MIRGKFRFAMVEHIQDVESSMHALISRIIQACIMLSLRLFGHRALMQTVQQELNVICKSIANLPEGKMKN